MFIIFPAFMSTDCCSYLLILSIVCNYHLLVVYSWFEVLIWVFMYYFLKQIWTLVCLLPDWVCYRMNVAILVSLMLSFLNMCQLTLTLTINPELWLTVLQAGFLINTCAFGFSLVWFSVGLEICHYKTDPNWSDPIIS